MGLRIRTNIAALNAQRALSQSVGELNSSMNRLASGKRINKAADDAAGLAISEQFRSDIRSLNQAKRNAADGVSIIQTAESGLGESNNILVRLRELAIQSASDTVTDVERSYIQSEYKSLTDEIDRIANSTEFNGTKLLVGNRENAPAGLPFATDNRMPLEIQIDKNYIPTIDNGNIANPVNVIRLELQNIDAYAAGLGLGGPDDSKAAKVSTRREAQQSISMIDTALGHVAAYRSYLGSTQNRLTSVNSTMATRLENLSSSTSQIADTDYAEESARYVQGSILQSAGTSLLTQASNSPKVVMGLLNNF